MSRAGIQVISMLKHQMEVTIIFALVDTVTSFPSPVRPGLLICCTRYRNNRIQQIKFVSRRTFCGFFILIIINVKLTTKTQKHHRIIRKVCILEKYKSFHAITYGNPAHLLHSCSPHLHHIEIRTECTGHSNTENFRKHTLWQLQNIGIILSSRSSMLVVKLIVVSLF